MDNVFILQDTATPPLSDRGLQYGDGFFTSMLVIDHKIANWSAHWQRLSYGAEQLGFEILTEEKIKSMLVDVFNKYRQEFNIAKLIITRGQGGKGYQPLQNAKPSYYLYLNKLDKVLKKDNFPLPISNKLTIGISSVKWGVQPLLAGIKHLNRLENVMAQKNMLNTEYDECIMLDIQENVISGTSSSICFIVGNKIISPKIITAGINSTSLVLLAEILKKQGKELIFKTFGLEQLKNVEEMFFCNAIRGIMPVKKFNAKKVRSHQSTNLAEEFMNYQYENLT